MGFFSSSSRTSTSVQNTTNQFDERIGAADNATVIQLQDGARLELSDEGTIAVADRAFASFGDVVSEAFGFVSDELSAERGLVSRSIDLVEARTQSEEAGLAGSGIKVLAVVGIAVAAIMFAPKILGKFA